MASLFDCAEPDRSKWWTRLDTRYYKEGCPIIDRFIGDYRWLSNFHPTDIPPKSTEHYYQAAKARNDEEGKNWKNVILAVPTPGEAKKLGGKVPLRKDWEDIKVTVMQFALAKKFLGSYELYQKLIDTKDAYLIEGNTWHDNFYGICIRKDCERCKDTLGNNILGKLLMELREILIDDVKNKSSSKAEEIIVLFSSLDLVAAEEERFFNTFTGE